MRVGVHWIKLGPTVGWGLKVGGLGAWGYLGSVGCGFGLWTRVRVARLGSPTTTTPIPPHAQPPPHSRHHPNLGRAAVPQASVQIWNSGFRNDGPRLRNSGLYQSPSLQFGDGALSVVAVVQWVGYGLWKGGVVSDPSDYRTRGFRLYYRQIKCAVGSVIASVGKQYFLLTHALYIEGN